MEVKKEYDRDLGRDFKERPQNPSLSYFKNPRMASYKKGLYSSIGKGF